MRNIEKIAKKIVSGGGAGIKFKTVKVDCDLKITLQGSDIEHCTFTPSGTLKINEFNAEGYDDGMDNVDGEKIFKEIDCSRVFEDAVQAIKEAYDQSYDFSNNNEFNKALEKGIEFYLYPYGSGSTIYSRGWTRSKLKENDDFQFDFQFQINSEWMNYVYFDSQIFAKITATGEQWYYDVFEYIPQDEFEADLHYEDCLNNYRR